MNELDRLRNEIKAFVDLWMWIIKSMNLKKVI